MRFVHRTRLAGLMIANLAVLPHAASCSTLNSVFAIPGFNDGALPYSTLTKFDGKYYGVTNFGGPGKVQPKGILAEGYQIGNGLIYSIDPSSGQYAVVHYFGSPGDGSNPGSGLAILGGKLYGTTGSGGANGEGVIYTLDPDTGADTVVASLTGVSSASSLIAFQGKLYGAGGESIFSFDPASGTVQVEHQFACSADDGCFPGGLVAYGKFLFGTASGGGRSGDGTLFRFDPGTGKFEERHSFGAGDDGNSPNGDLIKVGGTLYGTTFIGGSSADGTIYSYDPVTNRETVVYTFSGTGGHGVAPGLLQYNGLLFGATEDGSTYNDGTLFAFDPVHATLTNIHVFSEGYDEGPALTAIDGKLWGSFPFGGTVGDGALFAVDPASGDLTIEHNFAGAQVAGVSGLVEVGGSLFGTATGGGEHGFGSIYKVAPGRGAGETLHSFQGSDGAYPTAPLTVVGSMLYGTTNLGGGPTDTLYSDGTVFRFDPATRTTTILATFDADALGGGPAGPMAQLDGSLFGTTTGGGSNFSGTVFKFDIATGQLSTLASFPTAYGGASYGAGGTGLLAVGNLLYGAATYGGASQNGMIFSVDPATGAVTTLYSFTGGSDGGNPSAPLIYSNGLFYGSTPHVGFSKATIFSFNLATGTKTILRNLPDKPDALSAFTERGSKLYSTFPSAQMNAPYGGIIRTNISGGQTKITILSAGTVDNPASPFTLFNGALFGTTNTSTTDNAGTVFDYVP